jgi:hypothetical protein
MKYCMTATLLFMLSQNTFCSQKHPQLLEEISHDQISENTTLFLENGHNGWGTYAIAKTPDGKTYFVTYNTYEKYIKNRDQSKKTIKS